MTNEDVVTLNGKDILLSAAFKCFVFDFSEWRYWPIYDSQTIHRFQIGLDWTNPDRTKNWKFENSRHEHPDDYTRIMTGLDQ